MPPTTRKTATPRKRTTPAKTATAVVEPASETGTVVDDNTTKITFSLEHLDATKKYEKFTPPESSGCVGTLYVPLGVTQVKVLLVGPSE